MKRRFQLPTYLFLIVISGLLFIPFIGTVHLFDWEEITYAEVAREMLMSGNWLKLQLNFQPFYEKPPLFVWMEALSMNYFGINDFAARLPNAICGIATVWVIYRLGKRLYNPYFGLTWALVFVGSFFPQFFFKTAVIDPWFNLFVFIGIYHLSRIIAVNQEPGELYRKSDTTKWLFYSAFFTALAVLTKGPIGLIIVFFTLMVTFVLSFARNGVGYINLVKWLVFVLLINGIWMAYLAYYHGMEYLQEFVYYQLRYLSTEAAVEADPWYFHFMMLFIGCYPASAFVFQGFQSQSYEPIYQSVMRRMMVACLIVIVIIFTILKSKVINYTSVAYFPITFLATYNIHRIFKGEIKWTWLEYLVLISIGVFWSIVLIGIPFSGAHIDIIQPFIREPNIIELLKIKVQWQEWEMVFGIAFAFFFLVSLVLFFLKKNIAAVLILFLSSGYIIQILSIYFVPKFEKYWQGSMIEFYQTNKNPEANFAPLNHKSSAHLFYGRTTKTQIEIIDTFPNTTGREFYYTSPKYSQDSIPANYHLTKLYEKDGYVFWTK